MALQSKIKMRGFPEKRPQFEVPPIESSANLTFIFGVDSISLVAELLLEGILRFRETWLLLGLDYDIKIKGFSFILVIIFFLEIRLSLPRLNM